MLIFKNLDADNSRYSSGRITNLKNHVSYAFYDVYNINTIKSLGVSVL